MAGTLEGSSHRMDDPAAYLDFAASLRAREDLPKELLSSLQRDLATELLRRATEKGSELQVEREPWPQDVKEELLEEAAQVLELLGEDLGPRSRCHMPGPPWYGHCDAGHASL